VLLLQRHPGGTNNAVTVYGEATHSQVPRDGRRPPAHPARSRSAKMGRSDRNLYAQGGAARRRNRGASAPTLDLGLRSGFELR